MSLLTALGVAHVALPGAGATGLLHATVARVARLLPLHVSPPAPGFRALQKHSSPAPASSDSAVPVVPGTLFRIQAGANEVRVQHVAGWSDVATVQGQPGAGSSSTAAGQWRVEAVSAEAATAAAGGGVATAAAGGGAATAAAGGGVATAAAGGGAAATASEQTGAGSGFTGQPKVSLRYDVTPAQQGRGSGGDAGGGGGVLTLSVPEKWISLDVSTQGAPLSVSRLVEADLAANTAGGAVRLGAIRGLDVHVDTTRATPNDTGSVTGGDVSGTRVALAAGGAIDLRRVVGGVMVLTSLASPASPSAPGSASAAASGLAVSSAPPALAASGSAAAIASAASHSIPAAVVRLGAVYGGSLRLSTRGGDVRIGTLDCGGHPGVPGMPATGGSSSSAVGSSSSAVGSSSSASGSSSSGSSSTGSGGAEVGSGGGRITVDGLEGYAVLDSGGGDVKVLAGAGLRHALIRTAGGALDCALDPGTALELVEVRQAGRLDLDPGLEPHLRPAAPVTPETAAGEPAGGSSSSSGSSYSSSSSGSSSGSGNGVWRASVAAEPVGGRGGIRGSNAAAVVGAEPASAASGGRLVVEAGGGTVRLRRLGWMEALKAKMAEKQELPQ